MTRALAARPAGKLGRKGCISTASPVTQDLFRLIEGSPLTCTDIATRAGPHAGSLTRWKTGKASPRLSDFETVAEVIGYRVALVPR